MLRYHIYTILCCLHEGTRKDSESEVKDELQPGTTVHQINQQPSKKHFPDCNRHELLHFIVSCHYLWTGNISSCL